MTGSILIAAGAVLFLFIILSLLSISDEPPAPVELVRDKEVLIPKGYNLLEASAYGQYSNNVTFYLQEISSGRVFMYEDGALGNEVIIPSGYSLVAVSAYGQYSNNVTYYCRDDSTGKIFAFEQS